MATYDTSRFRTTHNSYSGGKRGSIPQQLDLGVRGIEFDIHTAAFATHGDFRLGHGKPGSAVALGNGNPATLLLRDWLDVVARWSTQHPSHAPITLVLDAKGDLTRGSGDLADLNAALRATLGAKLFTRADYDASGTGRWPDVAALHGRVLCVLSGSAASRASYRWTRGTVPAGAVNSSGTMVLAYRAASQDIRCWTGRAAAGGIEWRHDSLVEENPPCHDPIAAVVTDDDWAVVVYRSSPSLAAQPTLWSRVGRVSADGRIDWSKPTDYALGSQPSLSMAAGQVREVHLSADGREYQEVDGTIDRQKRRIAWGGSRGVGGQPAPQVRGLDCRVSGGAIECRCGANAFSLARYDQVAFVEAQSTGDLGLLGDALFFAAPADQRAEISQAMNRGLVVRGWGFGQPCVATGPREQLPATDTPGAQWYSAYTSGNDVET